MIKLRERVGSMFPQHKQGIYSEDYYLADVEEPARKSSSNIAKSVVAAFQPGSVVDVGCGTGALLDAFRTHGAEVLGLEYSDAGCALTRNRGISVNQFDIRHDAICQSWELFDVVLCTEVAEHIDQKYANRLVKVLTTLGKTIVFTAAPPGQGGADHVNEQPREYWIEKFELQQFRYMQELTDTWSQDWRNGGVEYWYWKNLFVFQRDA